MQPYFLWNLVVSGGYGPFWGSFAINNLIGSEYFHPGGQAADSGQNFSNRSLGYYNSLIPQPGRSFVFTLSVAL